MIIDTHQHFWTVGAFDYPWLTPDLAELYRDFLPNDLEPLLRAHGVERTVIVQASPTAAETDWLLDLAAKHDFIAGVVGWLDLDKDDFSARLEERRSNPCFLGFRPAIEFIKDDHWLARPVVMDRIASAAAMDVPMDLVTWPRHLSAALKMLDRNPNLRCVIDHFSKPDIRAGEMEPWKSLIAQVARHQNVFCKISGLHTQADLRHWTVADLKPYVEHVLKCFGPERLMFGSDWPVCIRAASYGRVIESLKEVLGPSTLKSHEADIFGQNAERFYRLSPIPAGANAPVNNPR